MTRYVFIGAGAIGSTIGGMLAAHGSEVLLVARGEHAQAMINSGLTLRCPDTTVSVRPPTITTPADARLRTDDVLVLTTKTQQAEAAILQWSDVEVYDGNTVVGRAAETLPIFTALNGVASEEIALRYFDRVFGVCVWSPTVMINPGEVFVRAAPGRGLFHISRYPHSIDPEGDRGLLAEVARDWDPAGCVVRTPVDVMPWKYRKLITNLGNVLKALLDDTSDVEDLRQAVDAEAREVLQAAGIAVTSDAEEATARGSGHTIQPVPGEPEQLGGSSWQSLMRGTGTIETDYLNGEIALIARRLGRAAPINAHLAAMGRNAARTGIRPGMITVDQLRSELPLGRS